LFLLFIKVLFLLIKVVDYLNFNIVNEHMAADNNHLMVLYPRQPG